MAVYVDPLFCCSPYKSSKWKYKNACHLFASSDEELLIFAKSIGLKEAWIQHKGLYNAHYDLTDNKRKLAVAKGAIEISEKEAGMLLNNRRKQK